MRLLRDRAMTTSGQIKLSFTLPPDQLERLDDLCEAHQLSRAAMVKRLLELGMVQQRKHDKIIAEAAG